MWACVHNCAPQKLCPFQLPRGMHPHEEVFQRILSINALMYGGYHIEREPTIKNYKTKKMHTSCSSAMNTRLIFFISDGGPQTYLHHLRFESISTSTWDFANCGVGGVPLWEREAIVSIFFCFLVIVPSFQCSSSFVYGVHLYPSLSSFHFLLPSMFLCAHGVYRLINSN